VPMLASFLKRDPKNLIQRDASPNFQAQNGLLSLRSWWRSVRSLKKPFHARDSHGGAITTSMSLPVASKPIPYGITTPK